MDTLILDLLDPEDYSDEFKADAVALYESTPGATYKSIAADSGINRATLREGVLRDRGRRGVGRRCPSPDGRWRPGPERRCRSADPGERMRQLEAQVAALEASDSITAGEGEFHLVGSVSGEARIQSLAPKSCVHQGPPDPRCTPTPISLNEQLRMLARWPELFIQESITSCGVCWPSAMFSPYVDQW